MKSVVLCEGRDDLWFIAYYLHKVAEWNTCDLPWSNYNVVKQNHRQEVTYLEKGSDSVAVWCVGGKDCFNAAVSMIFEKFLAGFPFDPIDSLVIVRDHDDDKISEALAEMQGWLPSGVTLSNKTTTMWNSEIDGYDVSVKITPVIIPFMEEGAIETLLMESVKEQGREGEIIVQEANQYINTLLDAPEIGKKYLSHGRLILKARYAAVIAATNPGHSTGLFRDMVMLCPWEKSTYVKAHFDVVTNAVSSIG